MRLPSLWLAGLLACCGCSDDNPDGIYRNCDLNPLPFSGGNGAPALVSVALECQGPRINLLATATDPQGDGDLQDVSQRIGVFEEVTCTSTARDFVDDFVGSGVEESFGVVVEQSIDPDLFDQICSTDRWPVEVHLTDKSGHMTTGRVLATVIQ